MERPHVDPSTTRSKHAVDGRRGRLEVDAHDIDEPGRKNDIDASRCEGRHERVGERQTEAFVGNGWRARMLKHDHVLLKGGGNREFVKVQRLFSYETFGDEQRQWIDVDGERSTGQEGPVRVESQPARARTVDHEALDRARHESRHHLEHAGPLGIAPAPVTKDVLVTVEYGEPPTGGLGPRWHDRAWQAHGAPTQLREKLFDACFLERLGNDDLLKTSARLWQEVGELCLALHEVQACLRHFEVVVEATEPQGSKVRGI